MYVALIVISLFLRKVCGQGGDIIFFPGAARTETKSDANLLKTIEEFASFYDVVLPAPGVSVRILGNQIEVDLPQAGCIPELTTVPLELPNETGQSYFPTCVQVKRCGGCCYLPYHSCQPLEKETLRVRVIEVNAAAMNNVRSRRRGRRAADYITVDLEQHISCGCDCKLKESDCNPQIQLFNRHQCACVCEDKESQLNCFDSTEHYWDNSSCKCRCRETKPCSSGLTFDETTCSCKRRR